MKLLLLLFYREVCKALERTRELFQHWSENCQGSNEVSEWVASQLRNGLRSLEWDLDDLEATLAIAKRQGLRDNKEISSRLNFIIKTRQEIQVIMGAFNCCCLSFFFFEFIIVKFF